jgi:hypothetical protein
LHGALVDVGWNGFKIDAGIREQCLPRAALRGQYQRIFPEP